MTAVKLLRLILHPSQYFKQMFSDCFRVSIEAFTNNT